MPINDDDYYNFIELTDAVSNLTECIDNTSYTIQNLAYCDTQYTFRAEDNMFIITDKHGYVKEIKLGDEINMNNNKPSFNPNRRETDGS